jgi:YVTN family beta-propeller protein
MRLTLGRAGRVATLALMLAAAASAAPASGAAPITPSGWSLTPAGRLITVTDGPGLGGPWAVAVSPDGSHALVTSSGQAVQDETVETFDLAAGQRRGLQVYNGHRGRSVFYGVVYSPDGTKAWASGGGQGVVHAYAVQADGSLKATHTIPAGNFPTGIAYGHTPLGDRLYVADNLGGAPFSTGSYEDPPGHQVRVINPATSKVTTTIDLGLPLDPFGITFNRNATKAYVTNWTGRSVVVIDTATQKPIGAIPLSPPGNPLQADHPTAIVANPRSPELYVANASSDTVSVIDGRSDRLVATIDVAPVPGSPKGSMPEGLAVSPDGATLYVAEAGENAIAVVDVATRALRGLIPTAWYPADVKVTPNGRRLVVVNTNGFGAGPNRCGPFSPLLALGCGSGIEYLPGYFENQYSGTMIRGSVQVIDLPSSAATFSSQLAGWTARVRLNNHVDQRPAAKPASLGAIKHVIYVIKENRTYDQVFGDLGKGNGDPALNLFGDESAPNHRALARRFVLLDNFYVDAEVSQDGHPWSTQATATDYVDKVWPFDYAWAYYRSYDSEFVPLDQQFPSEPLASDPSVPRSAATATVGALWDDAYDHNVSFRDYGEGTPWDAPDNCTSGANASDLTRLQARFGEHVDPRFPGWNMDCSDHAVREPEWEREFRGYERNGNLPGLEIVYFPNDHTQGTAAKLATPRSYMADNDLAVGKLVDAVSHSTYWSSTAIFVLEDDAQDGPDHVDAHRSTALMISPFTQHATLDSTHYDTASMLATIEDLLGLSPMSIYDQRATRMWPSFGTANLAPYDAIQPSVIPYPDAGYPTNTANAPLGTLSAQQDFSVPDGPDEHILNEAIWRSIKGADLPMPAPVGGGDPDG